ncbi:MAG: S8/S53 family peptidase [Lachnospiraceae bacterium]|nr:S8/S53 family peptidase [Lachnospiraceae bacterium]
MPVTAPSAELPAVSLPGRSETIASAPSLLPEEAAQTVGDAALYEPFADLRGINEKMYLTGEEYVPEDIYTYWFNQNTVFEGSEAVAAGILEEGKDPGLSISQLHAQGITGQRVTVAIIDQPLLPDHHPEYRDNIVSYHTVGFDEDFQESSMHGPAVASLLAGEQIGTAPDVQIYYVALKFWERNAPTLGAQALDWLIAQNEALPKGEKIRAVSISVDFTDSEFFDDPLVWDEAVTRAHEAGILVFDARAGYETCVFWPSTFDRSNRNDITLSYIGNPRGDFSECPDNAIGTPVGYRTVAEVYREGEYAYAYDAEGGHSWAIPYGTGVLALGWQINPDLTGPEMIDRMMETAYENEAGDRFLDPVALVERIREQ